MLLRSMQNTKVADAKAENDALRDDVAAGRRRLHIKASLSVSAWSHRLRHDECLSLTADTAERDLNCPQKRLIYAKTTGRNPEVY